MICPKCKNELPENAKFCTNCGTSISRNTASVASTIQLRCKNCNGIMTIEEGKNIMYCPYCGAKEMMIDTEEIAKEKIRSKTYRDVELSKQKVDKEVEIARLRHEKEMAERETQKENIREFKKSRLRKWVILFAVICALVAMMRYNDDDIIGAILPGIQSVLFIISWLLGTGTIRKKKHGLYRLFALAGFLLFIPYVIDYDKKDMKDTKKTESQTYVWPETGLATMLSVPESKYGEIRMNYDNLFKAEIEKYSKDQYNSYVENSKEKGFTIDSSSSLKEYVAFNNEGARLSLEYFGYDKRMQIILKAREELKEFQWPDSEMANLLPRPESSIGKVIIDSSVKFQVYIGDTTRDQFEDYIDSCKEKGFDYNYEKKGSSFKASNQEGVQLSLIYEGFNTILIKIEEPSAEKESSDSSSDTKKSNTLEDATLAPTDTPLSTTAPASEKESVIISKEFKEFVDSYEEFYMEYADFLENYDASDFSMFTKYAELMKKASEFDEKADSYQEDDLTPEEWQYYMDATVRIEKRLYGIVIPDEESDDQTNETGEKVASDDTIENENNENREEIQENIITVKNNPEFARIMTRYDYWSNEVITFLEKNEGKTITFPGFCLDNFSRTGENLITVSFCSGDHIEGVDVYGPCFTIRDTSFDTVVGNAENPPSKLQMYDPCYITATIDHYDHELSLCVLQPISVDTRSEFDYSGSESVKSVQEALNNAGYNCGTPDGIAGSNTKNMISKYREDNKLLPGDYISWDLVTSLGI